MADKKDKRAAVADADAGRLLDDPNIPVVTIEYVNGTYVAGGATANISPDSTHPPWAVTGSVTFPDNLPPQNAYLTVPGYRIIAPTYGDPTSSGGFTTRPFSFDLVGEDFPSNGDPTLTVFISNLDGNFNGGTGFDEAYIHATGFGSMIRPAQPAPQPVL